MADERMGRAQDFLQAVECLESFFDQVDSGSLFDAANPGDVQRIRKEVSISLRYLLVWARPQLEDARGIRWPYEELEKRFCVFDKAAHSECMSSAVRCQARLFLALLPFPSQWERMLRLEARPPCDPELREFLETERRSIWEKLQTRTEQHSKLHHFCQVLKPYAGPKEKGVLRIFSLPYVFSVYPSLLRRVGERYVLFVEPPMGIVFRHAWWRYFTVLADPVLFGAASEEDRSFLSTQPHLDTAPLAHGDFLEDLSTWKDPMLPREYDIVFNATFDDMERKRHAKMLELLAHPLLHTTRALFLGRGERRNIERFEDLVARLGLAGRVTAIANLPRAEVPSYLSRCRMGAHLSLYESGCRSIYELFRSDLPCVISSSMAGMNMQIFNVQTGVAVPDDSLPEAIASVLENRHSFTPRRWFLDHSGSRRSSDLLNGILRTLFARWGYEWHQDLVPLGSSGASRYVSQSDREAFRPDFAWLLECFRQTKGMQLRLSID